jgi:dolichol-phosphate mannosyltransferase
MIAVVIPSYRVRAKIRGVLERIGPEVGCVVVVDDACPENSGAYVESLIEKGELKDSRVQVLRNAMNLGVGGATMAGFYRASELGATVLVKLDGDGQMDPAFIPTLVRPIERDQADYTKGNRFYNPEGLEKMPWPRLIGNAGLSFVSKFTTGFWNIMDPTNGYVALSSKVFRLIDAKKISKDYFFETDLLFRLSLIGAVVKDVPMSAHYADEQSSLRIFRVLMTFPGRHLSRFCKRLAYQYFLRDFSIASFELLLGGAMLLFSLGFGLSHFVRGAMTGVKTESGALAITTISFLFSVQLLLAFLSYDTRLHDRTALKNLLD